MPCYLYTNDYNRLNQSSKQQTARYADSNNKITQMSQNSFQSMAEADVIVDIPQILFDEESSQTLQAKNEEELRDADNTKREPQPEPEPKNERQQRELKQQASETVARIKPKSEKQMDVLKKIKTKNKNRSKVKSLTQNQAEGKISLPNRKKIPENNRSRENSDIDEEKKQSEKRSDHLKAQILSRMSIGNSKFRRKNFQFEQKITKIKDIEIAEKNVCIRGEIIFIWEKQTLNQKWARNEMKCIEIYDGSGCVIVAIPYKWLANHSCEFQVGVWVDFKRLQSKQKYPKKLILLVNDKTTAKLIPRSKILKQYLIQPQKLGITLKQLQMQPVGTMCNVVCQIIAKSDKQMIRNNKGTQLVLSKVALYDPVVGIEIFVKLWEQKADFTFYMNGVVYLLRGIEIKEFKGVRQYHASKDFNYRVLTFSYIEHCMKEVFEQRWAKLQNMPQHINERNINQCELLLNKQPRIENQQNPAKSSPEVLIQWSVGYITILNIELNSNMAVKWMQCAGCHARLMLNCCEQCYCPQCDTQKCVTVYSLKCQFYDGNDNYQGEISQRAAQKLFSLDDDHPIKMPFLQQMPRSFKQILLRQIAGDAIRAIVATTRQQISQKVWVSGHYIQDILPFDQEFTHSTLTIQQKPSK